jgi:D-3-phosphoglycerate dehydrogenase
MTRVLIADKLHKAALDGLAELPGVEIANRPELTADSLPTEISGFEVLVVRSTRVTAATLAAGDTLGLVIRAGAGVNTIDVAEASRRAVYVANCPGRNAAAVAELAVGLMLALDRRIPDNVAALREGRWNKKGFSKSRGVKGRTVGIIGTGSIGREVIARLRGFDVRILAWSRSLSAERAEELGVEAVGDLLELARRSDIVSVHLALTADTRTLLDARFFEAMPPGAFFVNTSRAEVVDAEALRGALREGRIRAGLDVYDNEPTGGEGVFENELKTFDNLYGTHHVGASTDQAEQATGEEVVRIVEAFRSGHEIPNCVNLRRSDAAPGGLVIRHEDRVGVLAGVLEVLKERGYNVQEMTNQIFEGQGAAACARIMLGAVPAAEVAEYVGRCDGVVHVTLIGAAQAEADGAPSGRRQAAAV